jgi:hypothetical protein
VEMTATGNERTAGPKSAVAAKLITARDEGNQEMPRGRRFPYVAYKG